MALRKIIYIEDELLRKKSRPVEKFDEKLHKLLDDMAETMYNANGVGLAAPQVAVLRRAVVMDCGDGLIEMVNPEILETEGEQDGPEGCLSMPRRPGKERLYIRRLLHESVRTNYLSNLSAGLYGKMLGRISKKSFL